MLTRSTASFCTPHWAFNLLLCLSIAGCHSELGQHSNLSSLAPLTLDEPALNELSGLASSNVRQEVLWAVNDSGNGSELFAINKHTGTTLGTVTVDGVVNVDWEDLAAFEFKQQNWLLIADVGDNSAERQLVHLWLIKEPNANDDGQYNGNIRPTADLVFSYPDGARDVESVDVDVTNQQILIISKREPLPRVYTLPLTTSTPARPLTANYIGQVTQIPQPTAADHIVFGSRSAWIASPTALSVWQDRHSTNQYALLLTYKQAYLYTKDINQSWADTFSSQPKTVPMPVLPQAEALIVDQLHTTFWLTSEKLPTPLYQLPLPF